jgi:electron transport complex protein RnfG
MQPVFAQILKGAIGLSIFAVVTAGLITVTQLGTAENIAIETKKAQSKALLQIIEPKDHDNDLIADVLMLPDAEQLNLPTAAEAYVSRLKGEPNAFILPVVAPDGYSGTINMIVGISQAGTVKGVRILQHKETPGLGDKIDVKKSDWVTLFNGKSLGSPPASKWKVIKDGGEFDQFTGATITPRAVVGAVYNTLRYYDEHKTRLLNDSRGKNQMAVPTTEAHQTEKAK